MTLKEALEKVQGTDLKIKRKGWDEFCLVRNTDMLPIDSALADDWVIEERAPRINATIKQQINKGENMETITLNGKTYYSEQQQQDIRGDLKIVVLQRGWVLVGRFERRGDECKLHNASVIRVWGTTKGLGEIAHDGPKSSTKLDKCNGLVEFHWVTMVLSICCAEEKWASKL